MSEARYPDHVKTVLLKSKVGPTSVTVSGPIFFDNAQTKLKVDFTLDEDCRERVPLEWWNQMQNEWFDRTANLRYKEAFNEY